MSALQTTQSQKRRDCAHDWPHLVERASNAVVRVLRRQRQLAATDVARVVAAAVPRDLAAWLCECVSKLGGDDPAARIPIDILEDPRCPVHVVGGRRELLHVALFGVPGEGVRADSKRREAVFQQRCAEIMRETRDLESLSFAAARALGHPEVHADPVLHSMLRVFIGEREAEIRVRAVVPGVDDQEDDQPLPPPSKRAEFHVPLKERVGSTLAKLRLEFERELTHYNVGAGEETLVRIRDLRRRYPAHVTEQVVQRCTEQLERAAAKREDFRKQLIDLVHQAGVAIGHGDQKSAAWVLRRLSAINSLLPSVLPEAQLDALRERILSLEEKQERHEAARQLVERERAVGAQVQRLGAIIHHYHKVLSDPQADPAVRRRAQRAYHAAVDEVSSHDDDWLADLVIELDDLLEDLHGPNDRATAQVDKFVANVRTALQQMKDEIREIQRERAGDLDD